MRLETHSDHPLGDVDVVDEEGDLDRRRLLAEDEKRGLALALTGVHAPAEKDGAVLRRGGGDVLDVRPDPYRARLRLHEGRVAVLVREGIGSALRGVLLRAATSAAFLALSAAFSASFAACADRSSRIGKRGGTGQGHGCGRAGTRRGRAATGEGAGRVPARVARSGATGSFRLTSFRARRRRTRGTRARIVARPRARARRRRTLDDVEMSRAVPRSGHAPAARRRISRRFRAAIGAARRRRGLDRSRRASHLLAAFLDWPSGRPRRRARPRPRSRGSRRGRLDSRGGFGHLLPLLPIVPVGGGCQWVERRRATQPIRSRPALRWDALGLQSRNQSRNPYGDS